MAPFSSIAFPACPLKIGWNRRIVAAAHMVIHKHNGSQYGGRVLNGCVAVGGCKFVKSENFGNAKVPRKQCTGADVTIAEKPHATDRMPQKAIKPATGSVSSGVV